VSDLPFPVGTFSDAYDPTDEFSLLVDEAAEFGIATDRIQAVERVGFESSDGQVLSALRWGGGEPTVVLLHGGGLNAHTWDMTVTALGHPALAIDLPGHGHSAWRDDGDYRPRTNAVAVAEAIAALAPAAEMVAGQSLGGLTAIVAAELRPDLVRRLALVDISPGLRMEDAAQVRDFLDGATSFESPRDIVERARAFGIGYSDRSLAIGVLHNTRRTDDGRWVFRHHLTTLPPDAPHDFDFAALWPALEAVSAPVLLVHGTHGFLAPPVVAEFPQRVPGAVVVAIDGPHNLQEDAPRELAAAFSEFLG
jgi:pimeloyl-ACP methyl ester carboxylesterase